MIYTPLQAVRAGLLTRFFGTLGMALGVSIILLGPPGTLLLALWIGGLGLLFVGRTPGGRPPAWEAGQAIPWLRPGEEQGSATGGNGEAIDGEATEAPPARRARRCAEGAARRPQAQAQAPPLGGHSP